MSDTCIKIQDSRECRIGSRHSFAKGDPKLGRSRDDLRVTRGNDCTHIREAIFHQRSLSKGRISPKISLPSLGPRDPRPRAAFPAPASRWRPASTGRTPKGSPRSAAESLLRKAPLFLDAAAARGRRPNVASGPRRPGTAQALEGPARTASSGKPASPCRSPSSRRAEHRPPRLGVTGARGAAPEEKDGVGAGGQRPVLALPAAARPDDRWPTQVPVRKAAAAGDPPPPPARCSRRSGVPRGTTVNHHDGPAPSTCSPAAWTRNGARGAPGKVAPPGSPTPAGEEGGSRAPPPQGMREAGEAGRPARGRPPHLAPRSPGRIPCQGRKRHRRQGRHGGATQTPAGPGPRARPQVRRPSPPARPPAFLLRFPPTWARPSRTSLPTLSHLS